jgi:trigger factor
VNVTVENLGPCKKLLRLEVEVAKVDAAFDEVTKQYQREAHLPGFRPGKAPRDMVLKRYERDIREETKNKLNRETYQAALKEKKLTVVKLEDIEEVLFEKGQPYQFIVTVETTPEFDLPEYKGIEVKREPAVVTDADVTRAMNILRDRQAKHETVQRELREGDFAVINYKGTSDGKPLTDFAPTARGLTQKESFWVESHKGSFIPGFTEQLNGAKAGDKRTVNVEFPADFVTPQLANKKGVFEVEVVEVKEKIMPEMNDELAKSYGLDTLEKLQEAVRQDLQNEVNHKQKSGMRDQAVKTLLDKIECDLPASAVEQETRTIVYNIIQENTQRGVPKEMLDASKDEIYANASTAAKNRVKGSFVFHRIAEKEGIRVQEQDIMQRLQGIAAQYQMPIDKVVKELQKNEGFGRINEEVLSEKVVDFLIQNAKVEDVAAQPQPA